MSRRRVAGFFIIIIIVTLGISAIIFFFLPQWSQLPHEMVCQLTGADALNDTTVVNVYGTDVGLMVEYKDRLNFIFGDTFGPDGWDWRSNTMAFTIDTDPSDGIMLTNWITDNATHLAKELIQSKKVDNEEMTVIPTAAYSTGDSLYIYYMSVIHWGDAGNWTCNNASIAYSLNGNTFTKAANISWSGTSNFIEWGLIKGDESAPSTGGFIYFLTTCSGRYSNCYLARVPETSILDQSCYQYYTGLGAGDIPLWSSNHNNAEPIIEAPMGEISVMWNSYLGKYMLMNMDDVEKKLFVRTALTPWGPWSPPFTVLMRPEYRGFYAPNIDPLLVEESGRIVYFTVSLWFEYNVYLMRVDLTPLWNSSYMHLLLSPGPPIVWLIAFGIISTDRSNLVIVQRITKWSIR